MSSDETRTSDPSQAFLLVAIGAVLGAAVTCVAALAYREKLFSESLGDLDPKVVLNKVARALQSTRDRVVDTVDDSSTSVKS